MPETTTKTEINPNDVTELSLMKAWMCNDKESLVEQMRAKQKELGLSRQELAQYGIPIKKGRFENLTRSSIEKYIDALIYGNLTKTTDNLDIVNYIENISGFRYTCEYQIEFGVEWYKLKDNSFNRISDDARLHDEEFLEKVEADWPDITVINAEIIRHEINMRKLCNMIRDKFDIIPNGKKVCVEAMLNSYMKGYNRMPSPMYDYIIKEALANCRVEKTHIFKDYESVRKDFITCVITGNFEHASKIFSQIVKKLEPFVSYKISNGRYLRANEIKYGNIIYMINSFDDLITETEEKYENALNICYRIIMKQNHDRQAIKNAAENMDAQACNEMLKSPLKGTGIAMNAIAKMTGKTDRLWFRVRTDTIVKTKNPSVMLRDATELHETILDFAVYWIAKNHNLTLLPEKEE